jgi:integrase
MVRNGGRMDQGVRADDFEDSNGATSLTYHEAVDRARQIARGGGEAESAGRPVIVAEALDCYEADLKTRGGCLKNVTRVRANLPDGLAAKSVTLLVARELREWRDDMLGRMVPASVNRTCRAMKACLNLAVTLDGRISNQDAWKRGLSAIPDAEESRNVVVSDDAVCSIISCSYEVSSQFGLLVEVLAVTGARISQAGRLTIGDLQADRLLMPPSRKGGKKKRTEKRPIPIPASLVVKLRSAAGGRSAGALLLLRADGNSPRGLTSVYGRYFAQAAKAAGLDSKEVTIYALRHSRIVRQLIAGVPIRVVAS